MIKLICFEFDTPMAIRKDFQPILGISQREVYPSERTDIALEKFCFFSIILKRGFSISYCIGAVTPIFTGETLHIDCPHLPVQPLFLDFDFLLQQSCIFDLEDISILQECLAEPEPQA